MLAGGGGIKDLPKIPRDDFNRLSKTTKGSVCWAKDAVNPGVIDPQELELCDPKSRARLDQYVTLSSGCNPKPIGFTSNFEDQYRNVAQLFRQEFVKKELARTTMETLEVNLDDFKLTPAQKKLVAALLQVGKTIDKLFLRQQGVAPYADDVMNRGTADDKEFLRRYQRVWCEDDSPFCTALAHFDPKENPLYPKGVDCKKDIAGEALGNPFSIVQRNGNGLEAVPFGKAREFHYDISGAVIALQIASMRAKDAGEKALGEYIDEVAKALVSDKPFPFVKADEKWLATRSSRFFLRVGPDEPDGDLTCQLKAQYQMVLGIKDPSADKMLSGVMKPKQEFENYLAKFVPGYKVRDIKLETPEFMTVVMESGNSRGDWNGTAAAETLPNWCGEDGKADCTQRNLQFTNKTKKAYSKALLTKFAEVVTPSVAQAVDLDELIKGTMVMHEIAHNLGPHMKKYPELGDMGLRLEELKAQIASLALRPSLEEKGLAKPEKRNSAYAAFFFWCLNQIKRGSAKGEKYYENKSPYVLLAAVSVGYFTEKGALTYKDGKWDMDFSKVPDAANGLYGEAASLYLTKNRDAVENFFFKYTKGEGLEYLHLYRINETMAKAPTTLFEYKVTGLEG